MSGRKFYRCAAWTALSCLPMCLVGCGGAYDSTVSGVVTLDGNKITVGTVAFHPASSGPAAYARIEEDGTYSVRTGREEGLPSGDYQVTVTANEQSSKQIAVGGPPPPGKLITPQWYREKETSGLRYTIQPGSNEINLELKSQPPAGWKPGRRR